MSYFKKKREKPTNETKNILTIFETFRKCETGSMTIKQNQALHLL